MTKVLDHGKIELIDSMGNDLSISNAARVLKEEWRELEDPRLIKYMLKHGHTSPFEHVTFTFYVKAPIFVIRQWHRHRTWSFNEVSGRYKELPEEFYVPDLTKIGVQSDTNHQSRDMKDNELADRIREDLHVLQAVTFDNYKNLLEHGCPRELARIVLPLGTYTEMYATVDLHNLLHFLKLRDDEHAQYEIQVYAQAIKDLIRPVVPVTLDIWENLNVS